MLGKVKKLHADKPRNKHFHFATPVSNINDFQKEDASSSRDNQQESDKKEKDENDLAVPSSNGQEIKDASMVKTEDETELCEQGRRDDYLWVGQTNKKDPIRMNKKPVLRDEQILDYAVKQKIQEIFLFIFFLIVTSVVVLSSLTPSAAYLSHAIGDMFMDTPFMIWVEEPIYPSETNASFIRPSPGSENIPKPSLFRASLVDVVSVPLLPESELSEQRPLLSSDVNREPRSVNSNPNDIDDNSTLTASPQIPFSYVNSDPPDQVPSANHFRMDSPMNEPSDSLYKGYDLRGILADAKDARKDRSLKQSTNIQDFWDFLDTTFLNVIYWRYWYSNEDPIAHTEEEDMQLLYSSKLIGVPRIRQVRVRSDSCYLHPSVSHYFNSCITYYSSSVEDTSNIIPQTDEISITKPGWKYSIPEETEALDSAGDFSTYGPGGYYLDLEYTKALTQKLFLELKLNRWVTRATRAVIIDFTVYNANINLFVVCKLVFEMPPTGGLSVKYRFEPLKFFRYVEPQDYMVLGGEAVFIVFMFYFTAFLIYGFVQGRWRYLKHFGVMLTVVVTSLGWACVVLGGYRFYYVESEVADLVLNHNDSYPNFEFVRNIQADFNKLCAYTLFIASIRALLYLKYCHWIQPLFHTIGDHENRKALIGLIIFYLFIVFTMGELGYLLFGGEVLQFRSLKEACTSQFSAIIGTLNHAEIERVGGFLGASYFVLYVFVDYFLLLVMCFDFILMLFAAIISHSYSISRATVAPIKDRLVTNYISTFFVNLCTCCRRKESVEEKVLKSIREALSRAGFTQLEIDMFLAKFGVDANANASEEQKKNVIDKLELRKFEFDSIAVNPETVAKMRNELDSLHRNVDGLTAELERNEKLISALNDNLSSTKQVVKANEKGQVLKKHKKVKKEPGEQPSTSVEKKPDTSEKKQTIRPRKPRDNLLSGINHDLL